MEYIPYFIAAFIIIITSLACCCYWIIKHGNKGRFIIPSTPNSAECEPVDDFMCMMLSDGSTITVSGDFVVKGSKTKV